MKGLKLLLAVGSLVAGPVYADCSVPTPPSNIPDGATAQLADMVAAQKAMRAYNDEIKAYTDCLRLEHDGALAAAGDKVSKELKKQLDKQQTDKNNIAVDEATAATTRFNEQVRIYKARSDQPKKG